MLRGLAFLLGFPCFWSLPWYGFNWPKYSNAESLSGVRATAGH
jgi:hypothetical protein